MSHLKFVVAVIAVTWTMPYVAVAQTTSPALPDARDVKTSQAAVDPLAGDALYADVETYDSFGIHRYGSAGIQRAMDWLADRLRTDGLTIEEQRFSIGKQYFLDAASLTVGGKILAVLPQWWIPEDKASFSLSAPIANGGDATGKFVRLHIPYDQGAYLNKTHRELIAGAIAKHPAAVLLSIGHPSGEIFTYNVAQTDEPWPVPVILVAAKDEPLLEAAETAGASVSVSVQGHYEKGVAGRNLIGRLDRGKDRTIVVSTPVSSWFTSTCERAPGIAAFLATASYAARSLPDANFIFVATTGHEIGHGGMELFLHDKAPKPDRVAAWIHYGASLACYQRVRDGGDWRIVPEVDSKARYIGVSASLAATIDRRFQDVPAIRMQGDRAAMGELRDVFAAGYPNFIGMFGLHPLFHTPIDRAAMTGPAPLEVVMRAFAAALDEIAKK